MDFLDLEGLSYYDEQLKKYVRIVPGEGLDSIKIKGTPKEGEEADFRLNSVTGAYSVALGTRNEVSGEEAFSAGGKNIVSGNDAFAAGYKGASTGENSFTAGYNNLASTGSAFAIGFQTQANGEAAFSAGRKTVAEGNYSGAFGRATTASGENSFAEGNFTTASGEAAHAEGLGVANNDRSLAAGKASHAEGWYTKANGVASHTEGTDTVANGDYSHAEGDGTQTNALGQHSEGVGTIATSSSGNNGQHVAGKYNVVTAGARVTGGGSNKNNRKNIEVLDWEGNLTIAGVLTAEAGVSLGDFQNGDPATLVKGDAHNSLAFKATPNEADPSVDRTNSVSGEFSTIIAGSRNHINASAESFVAGGKLIMAKVTTADGGLTDGGNNAMFGYNQTMTDAEDCFIGGGYKNDIKHAKTSGIIGGRQNKINPDNEAYLTEYGFVGGGRENQIKKGTDVQTPGYVAEIPNYAAIVGGLRNVARGAGAFIGGGKDNRANYTDSTAFGRGAQTSRQAQFACGQWVNVDQDAYFIVGCGSNENNRANCFAAGWDSDGATEKDRSFITVGSTVATENQFAALAKFKKYSLAAATTSYITENLSSSDWETYGEYDHLEMWDGTNYLTTQPPGSLFMITGISTDTNERYVIIVQSLGVNPNESTDTRAYGRSIFVTHGDEANYIYNNLSTAIFA